MRPLTPVWNWRHPWSAFEMLPQWICEIRIRQLRGNLGPEVSAVKMIGFDCPSPASMYTFGEYQNIISISIQSKFGLRWSPFDVPHRTGTIDPPEARNWSVLQMWFWMSGPSLKINLLSYLFTNFWASPAKANCSKSNLIWQMSGWIFSIVSWQLPVPSFCVFGKFLRGKIEMFNGSLQRVSAQHTSRVRMIWINKIGPVFLGNTPAARWWEVKVTFKM